MVIRFFRCTVVYGTPTMYIDLITIAQNRLKTDPSIFSKLSSLEIAVTSGALCTPDLFKQMMKTFNLKKIYVSDFRIKILILQITKCNQNFIFSCYYSLTHSPSLHNTYHNK